MEKNPECEQICATCRFMHSVFNTKDKENERKGFNGECRKHAPSVIVAGARAGSTAFPVILGKDWCGDWEELK